MTFIKKKEATPPAPAKQREECLALISENCTEEELHIFVKLVQNPIYKKLALDYLKANLK